MSTVRTRVLEGGRIVIPATYRKTLGLKVGDPVVLRLEDNELRLITVSEAIRRAQDIVSGVVDQGRSLAEELIAERRAEAIRE